MAASGRRVWRRRFLWLVFLAALVSVTYLAGLLEPLELMTHDARFLLRGYRLASSDVVIVGVTRQCMERLGQPPWPRSTYADAIRNLSNAGARLICLDVFFSGPTTPAEDQKLVDAVRAAGNVIGCVFSPVELSRHDIGPVRRVMSLNQNFPEFTQAVLGLAHINVPPAPDGKCRAVPVALQDIGNGNVDDTPPAPDGKGLTVPPARRRPDNVYFGLGIEGALRFIEPSTRGGEVRRPSRAAVSRHLPLTEDGDLLINYYGQQNTFDFLPFSQAQKGTFPKVAVKGKLVLIGQTALGQVNADLVTTPLGEMYGVFVQGTIMDNILTGSCLRRQTRLSAVLTLLVVTLASGLLFVRWSPVATVVAWGAAMLGLAGVALYLFDARAFLVEVVPGAIVLTANLGFAMAVNLKRFREIARIRGIELSSILKSGQLSADPGLGEDTSQALLRLIGETIGVEAATLSLRKGAASWTWINPAVRSRRGRRGLDPETVRSIETAAAAWLCEKKGLFHSTDLRRAGIPGVSPQAPVKAFLSLPLAPRQETIGLLNLFNKLPSQASPGDYFTAEDLRLVAVLAQQTALILDNTVLIGELGASNQQLREAMDQLRSAQDALISEEKLSAIGSMVSMIIHDMRGPLTVATGYADMMRESGSADATVRSYSEEILHELQRISVMAQEVLDFSRGTTQLNRQLTPVRRLIDDVEQRFRDEFRHRQVSLETTVAYTGALFVDRERILNALRNLLNNGVDAMDGRGRVVLTCRQVANGVELVIEDSGKGIPEAIRAKLFEAFVTHGKPGGTGLGLAIVKKVVENHGGTIRAENGSPCGARMVILLPLPAPDVPV